MTSELKLTDEEIKKQKFDSLMEGVSVWTAFYRANPHRFIRDYFGIKLFKFQQIVINMMFEQANIIFLASRGLSKTFTGAVFSCAYCVLYPGTTICIASGTRDQSIKLIEKIKDELIIRSPNLKLEIANLKTTSQDAYVEFKNGSIIKVVTSSENGRGNRAQVLFVDEYRMVDKNIIDSVLRNFLNVARRPGFMDKPEYANYPLERTKQIYASSCWYESHWSYALVKSYVENMIRGRSFFCCSFPYQLAIKEGLLDRQKIEDEMTDATFDEVKFQMECQSLFFGESADGLYRFKDVDKTRKLLYPYLPKSKNYKLTDKRLYAPAKQAGEIRILSADIALMASKKTRNDATAIFINQMMPLSNGRYVKNIVYTENNEGMRTDAQALTIRKLFNEYDCDYLVIDGRGVGLPIIDLLMSDIYDPESGETYEAISCCNNEDIADRCLVPNAPKVIWAINANEKFNSLCATGLRDALQQGEIRLLISEYTADDVLSEIRGWNSLSPAEALAIKLPYINTSLLVNELINLKCERKDSIVKVNEKSGMRKDRYSSLSYNLYVAKLIEREKIAKQKNNTGNLALKFRAPKIREHYGKRRGR